MQALLRSKVTEGAALLTAGAIALSPVVVTPVADHLPALNMSSVATTLTSSSNPITVWVDVLNTTFNNIALLGQQVQADPSPILDQFVKNQLANVQTIETALSQAGGGLVAGVTAIPQALLQAGQQLAAGQISAATSTLFQAGLSLVLAPVISLLPVFNIPGQIAQNFANVLNALPNVLLPVGLAAISPIAGAVGALGDSGQAIFDALKAGDIPAAVTAIVNTPAVITDAFLNGYEPQFTTGILSVGKDFSAGLISALLNARDTIAKALAAPAPPTTAEARSVAAPAAPVAEAPVAEAPSVSAPVTAAETETADTPVASTGGVKTRTATTDPANSTSDSTSQTEATSPVTEKSVAGVGRSRAESRASRDAGQSSDKGTHGRAAGGSARSGGE